MPDATIPADRNSLPRQGIAAGNPFTVQIDSLWPDAGTVYSTAARPVKVICHTGGLTFVRPGPTCTIDDPHSDMVAPGGYVNAYPGQDRLITVISFIRKP